MKTFREFIEDCELVEGKIPWDDKNRPLRSGWTPREKNRAKRISTKVEDPKHSPSDKELERYGKLSTANDEQRNIKVRKKDLHKNPADYALGRRNIFFKDNPRMPSESQKGNSDGLQRIPRNMSLKTALKTDFSKENFGAKNDKKRDKYYKKGPKGLKEPKK
jgi:hypothetical protein